MYKVRAVGVVSKSLLSVLVKMRWKESICHGTSIVLNRQRPRRPASTCTIVFIASSPLQVDSRGEMSSKNNMYVQTAVTSSGWKPIALTPVSQLPTPGLDHIGIVCTCAERDYDDSAGSACEGVNWLVGCQSKSRPEESLEHAAQSPDLSRNNV